MLPVELSTDQCSLRPREDRLVLSALLELDARGEVISQRFTRGVIRSVERMTYAAVHDLLDGGDKEKAAARERYASLVQRFEWMRELALILNRRRVKRGSIDFDLPEALVEFDEFGEMIGVTRAPRNIAHRIIEEFMLAANEAVASHLEALRLPMLYRIHERPDPKRVLEFEEIAARFGYSLAGGAAPVKRVRGTVLPLDNPKLTSRSYQKLIAKIEGKPEERILSYLMLRSLRQARYSETNVGHFALAAPSYTHFTSPIRRYPDLIVHRVLCAHLDGGRYEADMHAIGESASETERRAAEAERELVEWKKAKFMMDRVGDEFQALIISTQRFGFFVELEDLFIEGLVPIDTLPGDRYGYQENTRRIVGQRSRRQFAIGDEVRVRLDRVDSVDKKLQFSVVEPSQGRR
jgi:ribonuclease R